MNMDALLETPDPAAVADRSSPTNQVGDFRAIYSGLSREFCRPLISLRAGVDLLLAGVEGPLSDGQRAQVLGLRVHCDDLIRLTRTHLDYVGLSGSPRPLVMESFRLDALIDESRRQFSDRAGSRGIYWECRIEGHDGPVETDLACFQQILIRLVENALDHTPEGGKTSIVAWLETSHWSIEVSDSGPGIPDEELAHVFEPLVRLRNGKETSCGSVEKFGMGLVVCRELVAHLGGEIRLRSSPDSGTSVTVRFPLTTANESVK